MKRDDVINNFAVLRPEIGVELHHAHAEVISFDAHVQHRAVCISFFPHLKTELIIVDPEILHLRHVFFERSKHRLRLSSYLLLHLILEVELNHGLVQNRVLVDQILDPVHELFGFLLIVSDLRIRTAGFFDHLCRLRADGFQYFSRTYHSRLFIWLLRFFFGRIEAHLFLGSFHYN